MRSLQAIETHSAYLAESGVDAARKPGNLNQWTDFGPRQVGTM